MDRSLLGSSALRASALAGPHEAQSGSKLAVSRRAAAWGDEDRSLNAVGGRSRLASSLALPPSSRTADRQATDTATAEAALVRADALRHSSNTQASLSRLRTMLDATATAVDSLAPDRNAHAAPGAVPWSPAAVQTALEHTAADTLLASARARSPTHRGGAAAAALNNSLLSPVRSLSASPVSSVASSPPSHATASQDAASGSLWSEAQDGDRPAAWSPLDRMRAAQLSQFGENQLDPVTLDILADDDERVQLSYEPYPDPLGRPGEGDDSAASLLHSVSSTARFPSARMLDNTKPASALRSKLQEAQVWKTRSSSGRRIRAALLRVPVRLPNRDPHYNVLAPVVEPLTPPTERQRRAEAAAAVLGDDTVAVLHSARLTTTSTNELGRLGDAMRTRFADEVPREVAAAANQLDLDAWASQRDTLLTETRLLADVGGGGGGGGGGGMGADLVRRSDLGATIGPLSIALHATSGSLSAADSEGNVSRLMTADELTNANFERPQTLGQPARDGAAGAAEAGSLNEVGPSAGGQASGSGTRRANRLAQLLGGKREDVSGGGATGGRVNRLALHTGAVLEAKQGSPPPPAPLKELIVASARTQHLSNEDPAAASLSIPSFVGGGAGGL